MQNIFHSSAALASSAAPCSSGCCGALNMEVRTPQQNYDFVSSQQLRQIHGRYEKFMIFHKHTGASKKHKTISFTITAEH